MPAVIRIDGDRIHLPAIIAQCGLPFVEAIQSQRSRRHNPNETLSETTYNLTVSEASGDSVPHQIVDADSFLASNAESLRSIFKKVPRCKCTIDFSWDFPGDSIGQYNIFPSCFLSRLVELQITLVLSVYGTTGRSESQNFI